MLERWESEEGGEGGLNHPLFPLHPIHMMKCVSVLFHRLYVCYKDTNDEENAHGGVW